jgi:DNA invertase Pin-like site-specific DNA recombinase
MPDDAFILDDANDLAVFLSSSDARQVRTWAYVRVSGPKQVREGLGQQGQTDVIQKYCKDNGLSEPVFIVEQSSGGKPLLQVKLPGVPDEEDPEDPGRPMLGMLVATLTDKVHSGESFVLWHLDRLSRIGTEQELLLRMLVQNAISVRSTDPTETMVLSGAQNDPTRLLIRQIFGAFAQYERHLIQTRLQLGVRAKAARGGWVSGGAPPYGYVKSAKDLIIEPESAFIVAAVHYLRGRGFSLNDIVQQLERRWGVAGFSRSRAHRILANAEIYTGVYVDPFGVSHKRPDLQILPTDWEAWGEEHDPVYQAP